jgi:hypothetical protein
MPLNKSKNSAWFGINLFPKFWKLHVGDTNRLSNKRRIQNNKNLECDASRRYNNRSPTIDIFPK